MNDDNDIFRRGERRSDRHRAAGSARRSRPTRIDRVQPRTSTSETARQAQRRRRESSRIVTPEARKRRRRRLFTTIAVAAAIVVLALAGTAFAFLRGIQSNLSEQVDTDKAITDILGESKPREPGKPFYMVIMGVDTRPEERVARSDSLIVAYVDPARKRIVTMSIPRDTRVTIPGRGTAKINEAMQLGGPAKVIKTVKEFTGLPITHYAYIDFVGFRDIVDSVGGVDINVPYAINDIQAAGGHRTWARIPKGMQRLDGGHAMTFVRARHQFADQDFTRMKNQQTFMKALAKKMMTLSDPLRLPAVLSSVSKNVKTDISLTELAGLAADFRDMDEQMFQSVTMPGTAKFIDGLSYVVADEAELDALIAKMEKGELIKPVQASAYATATVKPQSVTLTVRNGAGVSGIAKIVADKLAKAGFPIKDTGNMGQFVYGRTLVVFRSDKDTAKATLVREELGVGDVVPARGMYSYDGDILIIIGKDFDPKKFGTTPSTRH